MWGGEGLTPRWARGVGPCQKHKDPCDPRLVYCHISGVWTREAIQCRREFHVYDVRLRNESLSAALTEFGAWGASINDVRA